MKARFGWALASAMVVGAVGSAHAADMAVKAVKAPPVAQVVSWNGCYVGANGGWDRTRQAASTNPFPSPGFGAPAIGGAGLAGFGLLPTYHDLNADSGMGGLHAGCNWQTNTLVFGIEGDVEWLNPGVSNTQTAFATFGNAPAQAWSMQVTASNHWLASIRGRIGFAFDKILFYGTGGAAFTDTSYGVTATGLIGPGINVVGVNAAGSFGDNKIGWVAGLGAEYMIGQNWTVRAEYLYYQFNGESANLPLVSNVPGATCAPGACNWAVRSGQLQIDTVRVGVSYKFGGGPVVARY